MSTIINGDGIITAGGTASTQGKVVLGEQTGNGTNTVTLQAPASLAADLTFTMPTADGTNGQYLQTNGSGQLAFATVPTTSPAGSTGQLQYNDAGAFGAISSGTSGQVLQSAGAGAAPTWATPTASGLVLLSTTNVTGNPTNIDITSPFTSTYNDYMLIYSNLTLNTGDDLKLRFFKNSTIVTSNTYTSEFSGGNSSTSIAGAQGTESRIDLASGLSSTNIGQGVLYILGTDQSRTVGIGQNGVLGSGLYYVNNITFANTAAGSFTGLRFFAATGTPTFSSGVIKLYGIAK